MQYHVSCVLTCIYCFVFIGFACVHVCIHRKFYLQSALCVFEVLLKPMLTNVKSECPIFKSHSLDILDPGAPGCVMCGCMK